ncbi:hypothetical protein, partial [Kosakonia sp. BK9b]
SNQGHGDFQSPALPTELSGQRGVLNWITLASSMQNLHCIVQERVFSAKNSETAQILVYLLLPKLFDIEEQGSAERLSYDFWRLVWLLEVDDLSMKCRSQKACYCWLTKRQLPW